MSKEVMIVTGAGQISMAIARRVGYGKKIVMGDKNMENAKAIAKIMNEAGFDVEPVEMDLSSRESILNLIAKAKEYGEIKMLVNGAGVSPSQAPVEAILKVDLYSGNQLTWTEWLCYIIINTKSKSTDLINIILLCCNHDDRNILLLTNLTTDFKSIQIRKHQIKQDQAVIIL